MQLEKIKTWYPSVLLIIVLTAMSLTAAYLLVNVGAFVGPIIIVTLISLLVLIWIMRDYKIGLYAIFAVCVFMAYINRMLGTHIAFGVVVDSLSGLVFLIMLFQTRDNSWTSLKSWITYLYAIIIIYQVLQIVNPNAVSLVGWLVALRSNTSFLMFFVFFQLFMAFDQVKKFTTLWVVLAAIVGFYGVYQELFGLNGQEMAWIHSDPGREKLLIVWGHIRKFSILSDPSAFGLFMAYSGLACFVLMMGPFSATTRIIYGLLSASMFVSMSYSGTRTAIAMVIIGIAFYVLITLRNKKTFLIMIGAGMLGLLILFGPFYGSTATRIRSTFNASEDPSMGVRDAKRIRLQSYVWSHPFGGGLNTTGSNGLKYSAGHPLAQGWDADSGYLLTALELGWIGLILGMTFFFVVMVKGIDNYFSIQDPLVKNMTLVYIVPFMALSVAHFTQDAMFQKPQYLVVIATYALMVRLPEYSKQTTLNTL